jgi:hypothetical protein
MENMAKNLSRLYDPGIYINAYHQVITSIQKHCFVTSGLAIVFYLSL